jgi:hypothetical protein
LLLALVSLAGGGTHHGGASTAADGSKEPIITVQDGSTPNTGISGTIQAPPAGVAPMASRASATSGTTMVTFAIRVQDWDDNHPAAPTSRPTGILGSYTDTWTYTGSGSSTHPFFFWVDGTQEGTSFYVVVQSTSPGQTATYTKALVHIGRGN